MEVFSKMYSITYSIEPKSKTVTSTKIIPKSELPSPQPINYTVLSDNGSNCAVKISEVKTVMILDYRIVENMTWEDVLNEYLDKDQREKYQNYYDMKGGAIKAFSSPFAFAWEGYITSPFGYRVWDDGSMEYHKGVDFGVPHGTEELAVADGTVVKICNTCTHDYSKYSSCGCGGGYGNFVDILTDDGRTYITYGHMSAVYVGVGDKIKKRTSRRVSRLYGMVYRKSSPSGNAFRRRIRRAYRSSYVYSILRANRRKANRIGSKKIRRKR